LFYSLKVRSVLEPLGLDVKINLPGVGENLQDQPNLSLLYNTNVSISGYTPYATFATAKDLFGSNFSSIAADTKARLPQWAALASTGTGGAITTEAFLKILEVQHDLIFVQDVTIAEIMILSGESILASAVVPIYQFSRGHVHLSSTTQLATDSPAIDPAFFQVDFDLTIHMAAGRLAQEMWATAPASNFVTGNTVPGPSILPYPATDEEWTSFIRSTSKSIDPELGLKSAGMLTIPVGSNSHPLGSAAMMSRELGGVVDHRFKVYGTQNLRVVDASVIPLQISGHLTATLYALAEMAADMILGKI
jgi:choline dehydrogenase